MRTFRRTKRNLSETLLRSYVRETLIESKILLSDEVFSLFDVFVPLVDSMKYLTPFVRKGLLDNFQILKETEISDFLSDETMKFYDDFLVKSFMSHLKIFQEDVNHSFVELIEQNLYSALNSSYRIALGKDDGHRLSKDPLRLRESSEQIKDLFQNFMQKVGADSIARFKQELKSFADDVAPEIKKFANEIESKTNELILSKYQIKEEMKKQVDEMKQQLYDVIEGVTSEIFEDVESLKTFKELLPDYFKYFSLSENINSQIPQFARIASFFKSIFFEEWTPEMISDQFKKKFQTLFNGFSRNNNLEYFKSNVNDLIILFRTVPNKIADFIKIFDEEKKKIDDVAEAPKDAPLGQIAFAPSRKEKPYEKNTEEEDKLLHALERHFGGQEPLPKTSFDRIKEMMRNDWYVSIFKETNVEIVYRGIAVGEDWLMNVLKRDSVNDSGSEDVSVKIGKENYVASWSRGHRVAMRFSNSNIDDDKNYSVIMHAKVEENPNVMLDCDGLYKVAEMKNFDHEEEIICLGPVKIQKVEWKRKR